MQVGVIMMCGHKGGCNVLINVLKEMGYRPLLFFVETTKIYEAILLSKVKYWILSGTRLNAPFDKTPPVPMEIFNIPKKRFFLICFSLESALQQYGYTLVNRYEVKTEFAKITIKPSYAKLPLFKDIPNPMRVFRNHHLYIASKDVKYPVREISSFRGELMVAAYKNALLTQFHPEHSVQGRRLLVNWLSIK
jgi:GMP synthase-like glutamine amidotransferase